MTRALMLLALLGVSACATRPLPEGSVKLMAEFENHRGSTAALHDESGAGVRVRVRAARF